MPIGVEDRMSVIWEKGVVSDIFSSAYQLICPTNLKTYPEKDLRIKFG